MSALQIVFLSLLLIFHLITVQSIFEQDHNAEKCIKHTDHLFCVSLYLLTLSSIDISSYYVTMTDGHTIYESGHLPLSSVSSATNCFLYRNTKSVYVQFNDSNTGASIGNTLITMQHNTSTTIHTKQEWKATFLIWIAKHQCLEIITGDMFIHDDFIININLYRTPHLETNTKYNTISSSTKNIHLSTSNTASWSTMICLDASPISNDIDYVAADINITSYWTQYEYNLLYINNTVSNINRFESVTYTEYQGADAIIAHFAIGNIIIKYWQSCSTSCNDMFGSCWDKQQHILLQIQFPLYIFLMLLLISTMIILLITVARYGSKHKYQLLSDTLDFKALIWLMIELWDWCTDLLFILFLYLNVSLITEERVSGLNVIFVSAIVSLVLTYLINMVYMVHYLQMWSARHAPGITRLWLQEWSWFLISISMTFGGVHVALELCNSLITPHLNIFTMHVPHSEMVRTRKDRFITNVFCENIPFLIIYILYLIKIKQFESGYTQLNITACIGVITTVLSIILSSFWAAYRRGYAQQHPLALYSVQIHFKTERWKQYYIHCHNRICRALQNGLNVRKSNLIVLDQCSESYESMKIEARILKDTKFFGYKLPPVSNDTAQQILNCMISEFKQKENRSESPGNMELKNFHAEHVNYGEGEYVYNHNTGVLVLCNGIKGCFCPQQQMVTTPRRKDQIQIEPQMPSNHIERNDALYHGDKQPFKAKRFHEKVSSLSMESEWGLDGSPISPSDGYNAHSKIKVLSPTGHGNDHIYENGLHLSPIAGNVQLYEFDRATPVFKC